MTEKCRCGNDLLSLIVNDNRFLKEMHILNIVCNRCEEVTSKSMLNVFFVAPPNDDTYIDYIEQNDNTTKVIARKK